MGSCQVSAPPAGVAMAGDLACVVFAADSEQGFQVLTSKTLPNSAASEAMTPASQGPLP